VAPVDLSPTGVARIYRSIAMLAPGQPSYLSKEDALDLLERVEVLQGESRRVDEFLEQLQTLLAGVQRNRSRSERQG
jgi:hypothetical protein